MTGEYTRRAVVAAVLAGGVGGLAATDARGLLESFAPLSGEAWEAADRKLSESVASPHGEATVRVDDDGVPHVEADADEAAYFAVGYVQAFDRLFQLDLQRRQLRGRLSAVVGESTLESDEFHVAMDFRSAAEATWEVVRRTPAGPSVRAYADGVTAAIDREPLPLEFELLGYEPDEWTPVDTMLMEKQIAWTLTGSFDALRRERIADALGADLAARLYPERIDHDVPILREGVSDAPDAAGRLERTGADPAAADFDSLGSTADGESTGSAADGDLVDWLSRFESPPGVGSNSWVVSGEHTESGRPVVANDPHLSLMAPPVWYEQHVETPARSVRGVTFPGVPFAVIGANEAGAWGFTNVGADVLDAYRYEVDGDRYRYRGEWRPFETDERTIPVANGDDRTVTVRKTVHGPVLERHERRVGVAWTGLTATRTTEAIYEYGRSDGLEDVLEATRTFDSPTQNLVYADRDGRTAYYATGKLPIRTVDGDPVAGNRVFDGSAGEGEWAGFVPYGESTWEGFVPFEEKPHAIDPDYVATANQRVVDDPAHYVGTAYADPYRGARLYDLLDGRADAGDPMDADFHRALQRDVLDRRAPALVPDLLEALAETRGIDGSDANDGEGGLASAAEALRGWDFRMDRDSRGALVFARWFDRFRRLACEPVFEGTDLDESYYPSAHAVATHPPDGPLFEERTRAETMVAALEEATAELETEGLDVYGDWNSTGAIEHPFGTEAPFLNYPDEPIDGSGATLFNYRVGSAVGSSWRMVVEPGGEARAILPGGNSGDYFSPHYDDQFRRWIDGEYRPMTREADGDVAVRFEEGSS